MAAYGESWEKEYDDLGAAILAVFGVLFLLFLCMLGDSKRSSSQVEPDDGVATLAIGAVIASGL